MSTVFQCLSLYCQQEQKPILPHKERAQLGRLIRKNYNAMGRLASNLSTIQSNEPEGKFKVVSYPEEFTPYSLALIHGFYCQRKRPRIPRKHKILIKK